MRPRRESWERVVLQVPAPFDYERATSVEHAHRAARGARAGRAAARRRPLAAADDEAAPRGARPRDRHRSAGGRARLRPRAGRRGPDRRDDAPPRPARVRPARAPPRDLHRRRARDRRPGRPQPRHDRRRALPGRPVRGPLRRVRRGRRADGHPRRARTSASSGCTSSTAGRTRRRSRRPRCSSRSASRCTRAPAAPTRRSTGARATGPSSPPARRSSSRAATIARAGIALAAVGGDITSRAAEAALVGQAPSDEAFAARGARWRRRRARRCPTSAGRPSTSGTSRAC